MLYKKNIPIIGDYDVVVCGGGCAGFTAAIQSARLGASTCIIEKSNMLGGIMTTGRNNEIALFNAGDTPIIRGIGWEFVKRLEKMGYAYIPTFRSGIPHPKQGVRVNIPMAAYLLDIMCEEDNVALYYMSTVVDAIKETAGWFLIVANKGGLQAIRAKKIIDCTGDGDVCYFAGAQYELGDERTGDLQPGTLGFFIDAIGTEKIDPNEVREAYEKAVEEGKVFSSDIWPQNATPMLVITQKGNNINHIGVNKDYQENRTKIEIEGRRSIARLAKWFQENINKDGETEVSICAVANEVALRETRRIVCDKRITVEEYVNGKKYDDAICYSYYPIDLHKHGEDGKTLYNIFISENTIPTIPYRALLPLGLDDILVAGRCISGDRLAQSAYRVKASCMAMGQAAGAAAALSVKLDVDLRKLDSDILKDTLEQYNAIVVR